MSLKEFVQPRAEPADFTAGIYVVEHDGTVLAKGAAINSEEAGILRQGQYVTIAEVAHSDGRLRGFIEGSPGPGWISMYRASTGKKWVRRQTEQSAAAAAMLMMLFQHFDQIVMVI